MSRSDYSDDCEYLGLWRANVEKTISGKRGQEFLKDLVSALEAMPQKRLIRGAIEENGEVCAIGAVGLQRKVDFDDLDPDEYDHVAKVFRISSMLVREVAYINDEHHRYETPEARWTAMHTWAKSNLQTGKGA